jgi:iron complex transport system substrate-binding protein
MNHTFFNHHWLIMTLLKSPRNAFLIQLLLAVVSVASFVISETTNAAVDAGVPQRIVSMSLASDEILMELLPECGGLRRLLALSVFADDPGSSNITHAAKTVHGRVHSEPESLLKLKPDLVIAASFNRRELLNAIRDKNIRLITLQGFNNAADIARHILEIGSLIQCDAAAAKMAKTFLAIVNEPPPVLKNKPSVLSYSEDLTIMGGGTLFDDLVKKAGATNAAANHMLQMWPRIDTETLLALNPDMILVLADDTPAKRQEIKAHGAWGRLKAVHDGKIIFINAKTALSTSRFFAEAIQELRSKLILMNH